MDQKRLRDNIKIDLKEDKDTPFIEEDMSAISELDEGPTEVVPPAFTFPEEDFFITKERNRVM